METSTSESECEHAHLNGFKGSKHVGISMEEYPDNIIAKVTASGVVLRSSALRPIPRPVHSETFCCCSCKCTWLGRLLGYRQWPPPGFWFVPDVCGFICAIFTWFLILYAEFVVFFVILLPSPSILFKVINGPIFQLYATLAFISHIKAMFSDPGTVPLGNATKENIMRMGFREGQVVFKCPKCCSIKPDRAHHCSVCRRCVRKMDHHCPWVNNCVGEDNQKYFILFTMYICLMSCHALYISIHYFIICVGVDWEGCQSNYTSGASTLFLIFLIFEAVFFGLFTGVMFGDQIRAVWIDETGIESLKKGNESWERKSRWLGLESVFGHPFSWKWFSPFVAPKQARREIHMYTV